MLGVGIVAWLALVLAEAGRFRLHLLLALVAAVVFACVALRRIIRRRRPAPSGRERMALRPTLEFGAVLLLGATLSCPPHEAIVAAGDASVYMSFGRQIAETGRLEFEDDLVSRLPNDVRTELFTNRIRSDATGRFARFPGGLQIPDIDAPTVTAGFSPLFPVLIALFHEVGSLRAAFYVAPLFAVLSIGTLFLVAAHIGGRWTGWLAVASTLGLAPQLWFARFPVPEMVAQCLVMTGLLAWLVALRDDAPRWAVAAGWFLGLACFAKVDLNVLLGVSLAVFCAWRWLVHPAHGGAHVRGLLVPFAMVFAHNVAHYLAYASHYRPAVEYFLRTSVMGRLPLQTGTAAMAGIGLLVAVVAAGVWMTMRCSSRILRRAAGVLLAGLSIGYAINYAVTRNGHVDQTVEWLSWYVSWPVLLLVVPGIGALVSAGRRTGRLRDLEGPALLLVVFSVVSLQYLYDPLESGMHIWSMRRFVPVVLPLLMLIVAVGVGAALHRIDVRFRPAAAVGVALVLLVVVARPGLAIVRRPLWTGAVEQIAGVARMFPEDAVVLMNRGLAGSHIPTALAYLHDLDTVVLQRWVPRARPFGKAIDIWLARGRPVFFVFGDRDYFSFLAPSLTLDYLGATRVHVPLLERTWTRPPRAVRAFSTRLRVFRVRRNDTPRTAVDVGDATSDFFFSLRGFHSPERHVSLNETFRWTGPQASLTLPSGGGIELTIGSGRPARVPPPEVSVWLDGRLVAGPRVLTGVEVLSLEAPAAAGPVDLTIESTVFQPSEWGLSTDPRELGVRVYRVDFGGPMARRPPAAAAGAEPDSDR